MKSVVNVPQAIPSDVSIQFSCTDGRVAKHFLNYPQVGAMLEEMGGETVAKHVGRDIARNAGKPDAHFDAMPHRDGCKG